METPFHNPVVIALTDRLADADPPLLQALEDVLGDPDADRRASTWFARFLVPLVLRTGGKDAEAEALAEAADEETLLKRLSDLARRLRADELVGYFVAGRQAGYWNAGDAEQKAEDAWAYCLAQAFAAGLQTPLATAACEVVELVIGTAAHDFSVLSELAQDAADALYPADDPHAWAKAAEAGGRFKPFVALDETVKSALAVELARWG